MTLMVGAAAQAPEVPRGVSGTARALGAPLDTVLRLPSLRTPTALAPERGLGSQKVTIALPEETSRAAVLEGLADLLQAEWARGTQVGSLVLRRRAGVPPLLRRRDTARAAVVRRARTEQERLLREAFARARRAALGPEEEIFPGHWGRRGVPPGAERLLPFLDDLSARSWQAIAEHAGFPPGVPTGLGASGPLEPALIWSWSELTRAQQAAVRAQLGGRRVPDPDTTVVTLASRSGVDLSLGLYADGWTETRLVVAVEGRAVRELRQFDAEPAFLEDGPAFTAGLPPALARRAREPVRWTSAPLDYAQSCEALARSIRGPVVADYYTLDTRLRPSGEITLSDLFSTLHRAFGCRFAFERGVLLVRRGDWPEMDRREIPEPVLRPALDRKRAERGWRTLPMSDLAWLARRIQAHQIPCLREYQARDDPNIQFATEARILDAELPLLQLIGRLGGHGQRLFTEGLPWATLRAADRPAWDLFLRRRAPWLWKAGGLGDGLARLEPAGAGTAVDGSQDAVRPARLVLEYRARGARQSVVIPTLVPWPVQPGARSRGPQIAAPRAGAALATLAAALGAAVSS